MHVDMELGISASEDSELRASENREMKEIVGPQQEKVNKGWGEIALTMNFVIFSPTFRRYY
jgi:hypothetical protein